MKKLKVFVLIGISVFWLFACSKDEPLDESFTENQVLTLSFELDNKTHIYNIVYDAENNIVKVDNTDYYAFLEDGELITDVTILDTELTDYFLRNGGKSK